LDLFAAILDLTGAQLLLETDELVPLAASYLLPPVDVGLPCPALFCLDYGLKLIPFDAECFWGVLFVLSGSLV
jgi:hypothetical protein